MHLADVNENLNHKIVGGSEYGWNCFPDARYLDYESNFAHASIVYSTETQEIYQAEVTVKPEAWPQDARPYRWLNPDYKEAFFSECKKRNVKKNKAWDDVKYIDLEVTEDFLEKANAIFKGKEFDTRVQVPIDLEDDVMLKLCMEAHKRDITLNKMVEEVLSKVIAEHDRKKLAEDYSVDIG
jgi:hypothetical protein